MSFVSIYLRHGRIFQVGIASSGSHLRVGQACIAVRVQQHVRSVSCRIYLVTDSNVVVGAIRDLDCAQRIQAIGTRRVAHIVQVGGIVRKRALGHPQECRIAHDSLAESSTACPWSVFASLERYLYLCTGSYTFVGVSTHTRMTMTIRLGHRSDRRMSPPMLRRLEPKQAAKRVQRAARDITLLSVFWRMGPSRAVMSGQKN